MDEIASVARRGGDIGERIDVEGADDARIKAFEIKHPDICVQPGTGLENMASLLGRIHTGVVSPYRGRDDTLVLELAEVQKIERCDARGHPIGRHPRELAACERQPDEVEALLDFVSESRVRARVKRECRQIVLVVVDDFPDPIADLPDDGLTLAEHLSGHGVE